MKFPVKIRFVKALLCSSVLIWGFFMSSCSSGSEAKSFSAQMDAVDMFIQSGRVTDAYDLLKSAEKKALSAYARLGIYKRYKTLGETKDCRRVLENAYEVLGTNEEICAVYSQDLLRSGEIEKALQVSSSLEGGKYGSIHSEASIKVDRKNITKWQDYLDEKYIRVFYDAWETTGNEIWLKDAALIYLSKGMYEEAAFVQQSFDFKSDEDAYFWALVQYDGQRFDVCIDNLSRLKNPKILSKAYALLADCYYFLEDKENSQVCRDNLISMARKNSSIGVPSSVLVNSSIYYKQNQEFNKSYEYLMTAAHNNPEYVPGLVTYSRFAWDDSLPQEMSELEIAVRKTHLRTQKMRANDSRPKFLIADALYKMNEVLKKQHEEGKKRNEILLVEEAQLYLKFHPELPVNTRISYIYNKLEENSLGKSLYPPLLVQFAVHELIAADKTDEARQLFTRFIDSRYHLSPAAAGDDSKKSEVDVFGGEVQNAKVVVPDSLIKAAFGDRAAQAVKELEVWECELAAYFALIDGNANAAKRLYEYAVFESGASRGSISSGCSLSSAVNLAMINSSIGEKERALEIYGLASGRSKVAEEKSDILYRMAHIQYMLGKEKDALLSLDYSIALDKSNADARLLKRQIHYLDDMF